MNDIVEIGILRHNMAALFRRAATDKGYRSRCLIDANKAYIELTGRSMPEQHMVSFFEPGQEIPDNDIRRWVRLPRFYANAWFGDGTT